MSELPLGCRPISEAMVIVKTEATLAEQMRRRGVRTALFRGRYWVHVGGLFWQPVHWLARLSADEVGRPHPLCLGFASTVRAGDEGAAAGRMPLHLLSDAELKTYDISTLPAKRRNQLRKAWRMVKVVEMHDPTVHLRRLYEVTCSAIKRFRGSGMPDFERLATGLQRRVLEDRDLLVGGFVNGTLAGYFLVSCVEGVAYIDQVMLDTEYLSSDIGTGLTYETVMVLKRHGSIRDVVYGLHTPELTQLSTFKEGMGFRVVFHPLKYWLSPILRFYLAWRAPEKLYRITGIRPRSHPNGHANLGT
jgi:hypothetical protein